MTLEFPDQQSFNCITVQEDKEEGRYWKRRDIERLLMTLEFPDQQSF